MITLDNLSFILIFFFYGLAFFSMGLLVALEGGRASDSRLRRALRPLAGFGLVHALHEWMEMFERIQPSIFQTIDKNYYQGIELAILALSFVSLAAFGSYLLARTEQSQRYMLVVPLGLEAVWSFGLLILRGRFPPTVMWDVADVWTRYSLAIPSAALAAIGLIVQQRTFRQAGLVRFGRDSLWAAVAFGWYGLVGQLFTRTSPLPPSIVINQALFFDVFGFPVQLFRAVTAVAASIFVIRFLRAFQVETDRQIASLQEARLEEAQERERLRGELFRLVVGAQEAERQRIARDLHDETGQSLTAIGMGLRGLSTSIRQGKIDRSMLTLRSLENLIANSLNELQRLIADLRPSHLDDLGLAAAIRWYAGTIHERSGLQIKVDIHGDERPIRDTAKIAMFRVIQESLTNIVKHADASRVEIDLSFESEVLLVRVQDNGRGFDIEKAQLAMGRRPALGLVGMQERANLLGGDFKLWSQPGKGTIIEVGIPYYQQGLEAEK